MTESKFPPLEPDLQRLLAEHGPEFAALVRPIWKDAAEAVVAARARSLQRVLLAYDTDAERRSALEEELLATVEECKQLRGERGDAAYLAARARYVEPLRRTTDGDGPHLDEEASVDSLIDRLRDSDKLPPIPESGGSRRFFGYVRATHANRRKDEWRRERSKHFRENAAPMAALRQLISDDLAAFGALLERSYDLIAKAESAHEAWATEYYRCLCRDQGPTSRRRANPGPLGMDPRFFDLLTRILDAAGLKPAEQFNLLDAPERMVRALQSRRRRALGSTPGFEEVDSGHTSSRKLDDDARDWRLGAQNLMLVFAHLALRAEAKTRDPEHLESILESAGQGIPPGRHLTETCQRLWDAEPQGIARLYFVLLRNPDSAPNWLRRVFDAKETSAFWTDLSQLPDAPPIPLDEFEATLNKLERRYEALGLPPEADVDQRLDEE
ncbi:MAG: hypothetical protein AAF726_21385 [Planctomycetota bacterium]